MGGWRASKIAMFSREQKMIDVLKDEGLVVAGLFRVEVRGLTG